MYRDYARIRSARAQKERTVREIKVPAKLVRECPGLALDIGGSVMKVVYRTKEDHERASAETDTAALGTIRMTSFARAEITQAYDFIRTNAHMTRTEGKPTHVFVTGFGGLVFKDKLEQELDIRIDVLDEGECFNKALVYLLNNLSMEDLVHPFDEEGTKTAVNEAMVAWGPMVDEIKAGLVKMEFPGIPTEELSAERLFGSIVDDLKPTGDKSKKMVDQGQSIFPVTMAMCGSAFGLMKNTGENEFYNSIDMSCRGGRMCLAMANMFLGCKDYDEFLALAEAGSNENVDYCMNDVAMEMGEGQTENTDSDQMFADDQQKAANPLIFCLGKGVGKTIGEFKREDLAAAILNFVCNDLAMLVDSTMLQRGHENLKHVFFCGGFPGNDLTRSVLRQEFISRIAMRLVNRGGNTPYKVYFLKHGQHLGGIGCLISPPNSCD